jgi:hypothetical protein
MSNKKQQQQKANWIGRICVELPSKTRHWRIRRRKDRSEERRRKIT